MANAFVLERENHPPVSDPTWEDIKSAVLSINPRRSGFIILAQPDGGYLQTAGARLRMIVEWRRTCDGGAFEHFVVGANRSRTDMTSINTSVGTLSLQRNEIFSAPKAVEIFQAFYSSGSVPSEYVLRDVTQCFVDD
jgi:hypothetical protein